MEDIPSAATDGGGFVRHFMPKPGHHFYQLVQLVSYSNQERFELGGPMHLCVKFQMDIVDLHFDDRHFKTVALHLRF
jgi:Holliday junction resolvase RusA-like endonuclease